MTIGYALLDDDPMPIAPFKPQKTGPPPMTLLKNFPDTTECNYLVMFFVIGVLGLALKDMTSK